MTVLRQLIDSDYQPCTWDLVADDRLRKHWLDHFTRHLDVLDAQIRAEYLDAPESAIERFRRDYLRLMDSLRVDPAQFGRLDVLLLDELRGKMLADHAFPDPFRHVKRREDEAALGLLSDVLERLDCLEARRQPEHLAWGVLSGNIFDLGAMATVDMYRANGHDFWSCRQALKPRPWFVDDVARWTEHWSDVAPYRHAAIFVDNAGSDIVLGLLPAARWMLQRGVRVTFAANSGPTLNDITADELRDLLTEAARCDDVFGGPLVNVVATGNAAPLIDLRALTDECVDALADADLLWIHGMGRSLESNYDARFTCDALRTAVVKDKEVARWLGCELFDCVFRFVEGETTP